MQTSTSHEPTPASRKAPVPKSAVEEEEAPSAERPVKAQTGEGISQTSDEIIFKNGHMVIRAQFTVDNKLKCPFCLEGLKQVKRHINAKHKQLVTDQGAFEQFCKEISDKWKKQK